MSETPRSVLIVTDNWHPEVHGVVTTLVQLIDKLEARGHRTEMITPEGFKTLKVPFFDDVRVAIANLPRISELIEQLNPDAIHIATEGPLGLVARSYCVQNGIPFSSAMHTQFPDYVQLRAGIPAKWGYDYLRRFHSAAQTCLVPTPTVARRLQSMGFRNVKTWTRGVDADQFNQKFRNPHLFEPDAHPVFLYVGRIVPEKNICAFLDLDLPGTKVIVGDGPERVRLQRRYHHARFLGSKTGADLAAIYASADCLVFPSKTDTFGIVMLEAMASGTPVAAYPVAGPIDVIGAAGAGVLDWDLGAACQAALKIPRQHCRDYALEFNLDVVADQFLKYLPSVRPRQHTAQKIVRHAS